MENESESWINNGSKFHFLTAPWYRRDAHALCLDYKINPISVTHTIYSNVSSPLGTVAAPLHAFVGDPNTHTPRIWCGKWYKKRKKVNPKARNTIPIPPLSWQRIVGSFPLNAFRWQYHSHNDPLGVHALVTIPILGRKFP